MLEEERKSISGYYYRYKRTEEKEIVQRLEKIQLAWEKEEKIYPLTKKAFSKIKNNPRGTSVTFDAHETKKKAVKNLELYKRLTYLVKSTSRFFLKPDVGEVFDQLTTFDYYQFDTIAFQRGYEELPETDGEHFLCTVLLLKEKKDEREV